MVCDKLNVSIHALLAECDAKSKPRLPPFPVSIHALLAECDWGGRPEKWRFRKFQSTHSLRSATNKHRREESDKEVSIHALLAECDIPHIGPAAVLGGFNPRTPCGVRPLKIPNQSSSKMFQSTHSLRSATAPDHIHCYSTAQTILCANLPKKAIIT